MCSGRRLTKIQTTSCPEHTCLTLGQDVEKPLKEEKNKNGQSRSRNSNTPEICEEFILLIWVAKSTETSLRMQGESWRHQRQLQCHVKECFLKNANGNCCFKNRKSQGIWSEDKIQLYHWSPWIQKTKSRVSNEKSSWRTHREKKGRIRYCITIYLVHIFIPMPQAMKIPDAKTAVDKEWKKLETIPARIVKKVKSKKEVF